MIFEADVSEIKRCVTFVQNLYTPTELMKKELSWVEIKVLNDRVTLSSNGTKPFPYQILLEKADPILDGKIRIPISDLYNTLKTFNDDSGMLLFEQDEQELRIDDGVYPAEILILNEENNVSGGFELSEPKGGETLEVDSSCFNEAFAIARQIPRSTFLPASSMLYIGKEGGNLYIRTFNMTEMYEARIPHLKEVGTIYTLLEKKDISRLSKMLNQLDKDSSLHLMFDKNWLYVKTHSLLLAIPAVYDMESANLFQQLPFHAMRRHEKGQMVNLEVVEKYMRDLKKKKAQNIGFVWNERELELVGEEEFSELSVPYKTIQRIISKWPNESLKMKKGVKENVSPLIMESEKDKVRHVYILMGLKQQGDLSTETEQHKTKTA